MLKRTFLNGSLCCLVLMLVQLMPPGLMAQGRLNNNWLFGSSGQGIRFNFSDDSLASDPLNATPMGQGSSAVATDPQSGDILFYTDGSQIYQPDGTAFPGVTLPGDPNGNQQVAITPDPAVPDQYFVYVIDAVTGEVVYYTVTVTRSARGVPSVGNVTGPSATDMADAATLLTVPNPQNNSFWLISQVAGTATYQYLEVTDAGPQASQTYSAGADGAQPMTATGTAYNPATGRFSAAGPQGLHILEFDPQLGTFGYVNHNTIASYDVAFSPDGSKLYVTNGPGNQVAQYDLENQPPTPTPLATGLTGTNGIFGIQQGPEGSVYFLYENGGASQIGRINFADSTSNLLTYETALLDGTDFGGRRFSQSSPATTPDYSFVDLRQSGQCTNNPVQLVPEFSDATPEPDSIVWDIGGERFVGVSPSFTPEQAAPVTATAYWPDTSTSISFTPQLSQFDLQVPLVQDTTICPGDTATLNAEPEGGGQGGQGGGGGGGGSYTYYWSTGETTPEIQINAAGIYWVLVTDQNTGCTAYAESNVREYQVENQTYNVWYFGNGAGIDFNTLYDNPNDPDDNDDGQDNDGQITPVGDGAQNAPEGVAAVSDSNGDILFYTDGQTVYFLDRETGQHVALPDQNGAPVQISPSNESTMVGMVQVPGTDGMFYVFTATPGDQPDEGYELRYSIVDLKTRAVVSSNNLLFARSTERITIVGGRGSAATLIAHEYGSNTFRAYPITEQGIGNPVLSSVGSVHELDDPAEATGYMKVGGDSTGTILAVVVPGDNPRVELFNFDQQTLEISEPVSVDFTGDGQPYGVEVASDSSGNTVVYVTTDNGIYGATVVRPVDADNPPDFIQVNNTGGQAFGAIQRAPDGQLYVTQPGSSNLGTVAFNPNDIANSTFTPDGLQEPFPEGGSTGLGLPDYIDQGGNSFPEPSITVDDACVGLDINFSAQGRDNVIETYFWTVERLDANGNAVYSVGLDSATAQSFTMPIDTVGRYRASVLLSNPCDIDTVLVQEFDVGQAAEITLPESANLCNGLVELTAIDPGTPDIGNYSFAWVQVGTVGGGSLPAQNTITVEEGGTYRVTVTNADGCENDGEVFVFDNRPDINLPEDFTLCQNETRELDVEIASPADPGYEWIILDTNDQQVAASNEPVIEVSELTPDPGLYRYTVTVTDNSPEGCFVRDTVVVTIEQAPELGEPATTDPTCGNADGEISLDLAGADPATLTFAWVDPNGTAFSAGQTATGLASGNYQVTVSNAVGCSTTQTIGLNDSNADFTVDATGVAGCDSTGYLDVSLDLSALTGTGNLDIEITNVPGTYAFAYDVSNDPIPTFVVPTPPTLGPGTYNIQVTERTSGCRQTAEATIGSPPAVPVDLADRLISSCQSPATVEVLNFNTNYSYTWRNVSPGAQPGTGFSGPRTSFSAQVTQSGTYEVTVSDLSGTLCDSTRQVEVEILPPVIIDGVFVAENNSCETGEATLEVRFTDPADSARNLIYNWVRTDTSGLEQTLPQGGRVITVDQSGEYRVSVRERNNNDPSCAASASTSVAVSEPLSAAILFGNTCADGSDIPLVARVSPAVDNYRYDWFGPTGEQLPNTLGDTLLVTSNMPEGRYRVEVNSPDGCTTDATATIRRNPVPEVDLGETQIICTQDSDPEVNSVELSISETYAATTFSITWTRPGGLQELNTTTILANEAGTYTVEVSNQFGCVATDSVEILDDCRPRIVAPNAFRPNGVNNEFFVYSRYVAEEDFEVKIYNRWGELVYYSTDPDFRWDGTYNGQPAPLGTYPYVINYRASTSGDTGEVLEERGGITIVR